MTLIRRLTASNIVDSFRRTTLGSWARKSLVMAVVLSAGLGSWLAFAAGLTVNSHDLTTSGAEAAVYFGATDVGNSSCTVPTSGTATCTTAGSFSTTTGRSELILVDLVGSVSTGTTLSSISGPFSSPTAVTSTDYPASSDKNVLFALKATGNGSGTTSVTFSANKGTANIEVVELRAGNTLVTSSTGAGTTPKNVSTFTVAITPSNSANSEIAFLGTDGGNQFTPTPSGWTQLPSSTPTNWNSFSSPIIASSQTFTINNSKQDWGFVAMEINP